MVAELKRARARVERVRRELEEEEHHGNNASPLLRHAIRSYAQSERLDCRAGTAGPTVPGQGAGAEAACGPQGCEEDERPAEDECGEAHPRTAAGRERA
eukprot:2507120-Rhodomonas_salina.2